MQITIIYENMGVFLDIEDKFSFDWTEIFNSYMFFDITSNFDQFLAGIKVMLLTKDYPLLYHNISAP
jgi:hypothetical protein